MSPESFDAYDQILYEGRPSPERHPDRFRIMAQLFGLEPPPLETMKILELGCSTGSNLFPIALQYPKSVCVGIDASERHIQKGRASAKEIGLKKGVELLHCRIEEFDPKQYEPFDYIICHGVFSWVDDTVRNAIFRVISESLASTGIAYVSYNVLPGWTARGEIRSRLLESDTASKPLLDRATEAREVLKSWEFEIRSDLSKEAVRLKEELRQCIQQSDAFLVHELLNPVSQPFFFREFVGFR